MPQSPDGFGPYLRELRARAGLRLVDVAEALGITGAYVSELERGTRPPPTDEKLDALAALFGVTRDEIYARARRLPADVLAGVWRDPEAAFAYLRELGRRGGRRGRKR